MLDRASKIIGRSTACFAPTAIQTGLDVSQHGESLLECNLSRQTDPDAAEPSDAFNGFVEKSKTLAWSSD